MFLEFFWGVSFLLGVAALGKITVERRNIVDNAGYFIRNSAIF